MLTANFLRINIYLTQKIGEDMLWNIAINDAVMLDCAVFFLLKKYLRNEAYYVDVVEIFHNVCSLPGLVYRELTSKCRRTSKPPSGST